MPGDDLRRRFERLALPLQSALFRAARALASSDADASDLVQETYYRAYRAFGRYREENLGRAWLFTILRNVHADACRRRGAAPLDLDGPGRPEAEAPPLPNPALPEEMAAALGRLRPAHHLLLILREVQGFSYQEIAQILGCPPGSVMSGLHHARNALRRELEPRKETTPGK